MRRYGINAAMLIITALFLLTGAQAQTADAPTPEKIELTKDGEVKAIKYTLKQYEIKRFAARLLKNKYLYVYFLDPSLDNAPPSAVKLDSAQTTYSGAPGTTNYDGSGVKAKIEWEVTNGVAQKVFSGTDAKADHTQISADGDYLITLKCISSAGCDYWLRVKVDKEAPQPVTIDLTQP